MTVGIAQYTTLKQVQVHNIQLQHPIKYQRRVKEAKNCNKLCLSLPSMQKESAVVTIDGCEKYKTWSCLQQID